MDQLMWVVIAALGIVAASALYRSSFTKVKAQIGLTKSRFEDFGTDLTMLAKKGDIDPLEGREKEIERTIHILLRRQKNNPLLLGEPGVGKTAIAHGLAQRITEGNVPPPLLGKRLFALDVNALIADTKLRGELERRLHDLLETLEYEETNVILFIDEIHMLAQIGGAEGSLNISDVLKPALARGELQVIGATTWNEYEKFIKPDTSLERRFQPVIVEEPTPKQTIAIITSLRPLYEEFHGVKISDEAIKAAVTLANKKIVDRFLPDKAIDLIDEASAKAAIESSQPHHVKAVGLIYAASKGGRESTRKRLVTVQDVESVVSQWTTHMKQGKKQAAQRRVK